VTRRNQIVRQRARLKTIAQSILHAHLVPPCPHADLFGPTGRAWLLAQTLPADEGEAIHRHLREYDRLSEDLRVVERGLARDALANAEAKRLMTIPGPVLSGWSPISVSTPPFISPVKGGPGMVGSANRAALMPGLCWSRRPGKQYAHRDHCGLSMNVSQGGAGKLAVIIWHLLTREEDYAWVRPALHAKKLRDLELRAGVPCGMANAVWLMPITSAEYAERKSAAPNRPRSRIGR
jgi:hypothetical protein